MNPYFAYRVRAAVLACLLAGPALARGPRLRPAPPAALRPAAATPHLRATRPQPDSTKLKPARRPSVPTTTPPARPAAALPAATSASPQVVTLRGVVLRPTGQPCAGASVYATQAPRQAVATDAQGAFALAVPAGTAVVLRVEYFGEGSSRVAVPLPTPNPLHITLGQ